MKPEAVNNDKSRLSCDIKPIWQAKVAHPFNDLLVTPLFKSSNCILAVGHEDGVVRIYSLPTASNVKELACTLSLETKGGPIQALVAHDVTRLSNNDLVVADSRGVVTVFCNGHILTRRTVSENAIQCLQIQKDALGQNTIVTGDQLGHLSAFSPYTDKWRLRLQDAKLPKPLFVSAKTCSLLTATLCDSHGQQKSYVLAADNNKHLYVIHQGTIVQVLDTSANITAMCCGRFVEWEKTEASSPSPGHDIQVALGTDAGEIYIMANFEVYEEEFCNVQLPVTSLKTLPAADSQSTDSILCSGHFNAMCVLRDGEIVSKYKTPSWINSVVTTLGGTDARQVIVGCQDNSIHGLQIQFG